MLAIIFECSYDTVKRRIDTLLCTGDIDEAQICASSKMPYSNGSLHDVTLYNLTVFNKIGMTFINNLLFFIFITIEECRWKDQGSNLW